MWLWALFALSLLFVAGLIGSAVKDAWQIRNAGQRVADLNRFQVLDLQTSRRFGWADAVADHYSQKGSGSIIAGTSLSDFRHARADARRNLAVMRKLAGNNAAEVALIRQMIPDGEQGFSELRHVIALTQSGNLAASRAAYEAAAEDEHVFYGDINNATNMALHDQKVLAERVVEIGHRAKRRALEGGALFLLLLAGYTVLLVWDARTREQTVRALAISEDRYRGLFENASDPVFLLEADGRIAAANRAWQALLGYDPSARPVSIYQLIAPEARQAVDRLISGNELRSCELEMLTSAGGRVLLEVNAAPRRKGSAYSEAIARNITERRLLEAQLSQAQTMQALSRLSAGIAHDFNNLLTVILARCDQIGWNDSTGRSTSALDAIRGSAERMAGIVGQLLAMGQARLEDPAGALDLNEQLRENLTMLRRVTGDGIEIELHLQPDPAIINANSARIAQMLVHLASNASDCMPDGGELVFCTDQIRDASPAGGDQTWVRLTVQDSGHGWDEQTQAHLFEPFSTGIRVGRTGGMALAAVYGIVRQFNGTIRVDSKPGAGATFEICFPRPLPREQAFPVLASPLQIGEAPRANQA